MPGPAAVHRRQGIGVEHRARPGRSGPGLRARRRGCTSRTSRADCWSSASLPDPGRAVLVGAARQRTAGASAPRVRAEIERHAPGPRREQAEDRAALPRCRAPERQVGAQLEKEAPGPERHRGLALERHRPGLGEVEGPLDREAPEVAAGALRDRRSGWCCRARRAPTLGASFGSAEPDVLASDELEARRPRIEEAFGRPGPLQDRLAVRVRRLELPRRRGRPPPASR